jgi:hypothetical protein
MATNLQTFSGEVEIPEGNLQLKRILELSGNNASTSNTGILFSRNLGSTSNSNVIVYFDEATESLRFGHTLNASSDSEIIMDSANVLNVNVFGEVEASYFKGDGGLLSNLVTDLQSVTENGAETDQTLVLTNAVTGIDVQTGNVNVAGNVTASIFFGDGGLLSNITQTLQGITEIGNTTSIALEFNNVTTGFVTTSNVGIVNTSPQHNFSVGSNLYVHDTDSNVLTVEGNVSAHKLTLGTIEITPAYGLENVTNISNLAHATLLFQNTTTAFVTTAMAGIGLEPDSSDVGASGLHVDGHLRLGGPAGTDENSDIYLRTAGQLNIESNDTDTDNQYTALALRAGNANESNIVVEGALSDTSKQYISFGVRNQERMKIDREGNVTVGYASTSHKLDVAGSANVTTLNASNLVINTVSISVQYDLDQTLENGNVSTNVITVGKVSVTDPTLAQTASNLVTWNATTKEFEDSGGLISNKLAIVSEQPPVALTGDSTVVDGHGRYKVTSSLEAGAYEGYKAFDKTIGQGTAGWSTGAVGAYNSNGTYAGSNGIAGVNGEWVKIEFPYKTTLRHVALASRDSLSYPAMPEDFSIVASNDDSTWVVLKSVDGQAWSSTDYVNFVVDASTAYKYYAIVVELTNNNFAQIGEWKLFTETFTVDGGVVSTTAAFGFGTLTPASRMHHKQAADQAFNSATLSSYQNGLVLERNGTTDRWTFAQDTYGSMCFFYNTARKGYLLQGGTDSNVNFTGQHRTFIKDIPFTRAEELEGLIVSADNNKYIKMSGGIEVGSNAITTNESLPVVSLSTNANDKKCFGVISTSEDPEKRQEVHGNFVSDQEKELGDTRVYINSVGEGAMWVTNINGSLESGDYITTSNVPGYGQKQDSEFLANYTVAKITMDCDFDPVTQPIQIIKKELANVNYWVKTTYSNVSLEEYSNLADENRTTEDETYYTKDVELKYTYKPTVTVTSEDPWDDVSIWPSDATYAEWSNLEANVQNTYTLTYMQNDFDSTRYEKTTVSNVSGDDVWDTVDISPYISYDEWSNLEANVQNTFTITYMQSVTTTCTEEAFSNLTVEEQNTYTLVYTKTVTEEVSEPEGAEEHTRTIYKKVERNETKTEPTEDADEWVLDVRQELVNILDEHGQLQWEDDPSGATEKAFKIRHLDASGAQTDEANAVHIAAFVGCTYHCG